MTTATTQNHVISSSSIAGQASKTAARKFEGVKRTNAFTVALSSVIEIEGFNARMDSVENAEHIDAMARSFAAGSQPEPIRVTPVELEDGRQGFKLYDGHCTTRAIHRANSVYGAEITEVSARIESLSEAEQRKAIALTNRQKKLNMIERGKLYSDMRDIDGLTQMEIAEALGVNQTEVSNCINAFEMPESLKNLVARGIMSDNQAFLTFRNEVRAKGQDEKTTARKASRVAQSAMAMSRQQLVAGKPRKVRNATPAPVVAKKVRIGAKERETLTTAGETLNSLLENVEANEGQNVQVSLTPEQLEILKKAGAVFA